ATDRVPGGDHDVVPQVVDHLTPFHVQRKQTPINPTPTPSHARPTGDATVPNSAVAPAAGSPHPSGSDDKGGGGSGSDEGSVSPTARPSQCSGAGDDPDGS